MKTLNRLNLFFVISGLVEIFSLVLLTQQFYIMIVGGITAFTAYVALKDHKLKWNYFVGIWALIKYNPFGLVLIFFLLSGFLRDSVGSTMPIVIISIAILVLLIAIFSFVLGIILIVKTSKYIKSQNKP